MKMLAKMRPDRLKMHQKMVENFGPALPLAYCLKWTKFGKLFLRKLIKIDATRCLDFSSKCVWRPGSARTRWGSLSAPPDPLAAMRGAYF